MSAAIANLSSPGVFDLFAYTVAAIAIGAAIGIAIDRRWRS